MDHPPASATVLALESSGSLASVAVSVEGEVAARAFLDRQGRHAAHLVPAVDQVLREAGLERGDLAAVVVGAGPGSFTGVRVAAATAKGLVHALSLPLFAYTSLAAAAVAEWVLPGGVRGGPPSHVPAGRPRHVLFDARADRVYSAAYRVGEAHLEVLRPPAATRIAEVVASGAASDDLFVGDGALRHETRLQAGGLTVLPAPAGIPTADGLLHLFRLQPGSGRVERPGEWEPQYLKRSSAERLAG